MLRAPALRSSVQLRTGAYGTNIANAITFAASMLNAPAVNSDSKHLEVVTDGDLNF
jgi:hypothetical protein